MDRVDEWGGKQQLCTPSSTDTILTPSHRTLTANCRLVLLSPPSAAALGCCYLLVFCCAEMNQGFAVELGHGDTTAVVGLSWGC